MYLAAIIDWAQPLRPRLATQLRTPDGSFCLLEMLEEAVRGVNPRCSTRIRACSSRRDRATGVGGRGREHGRQGTVLDNVFVERL